jgi:hypothetical protein
MAGGICLLAAAGGALVGGAASGGLGAVAVVVPAGLMALFLRRLGRREASLMAAVALAAPCARLTVSVIVAVALWLAIPLDAAGFWGAFIGAALGTLTLDTLGFAADFRTLATRETQLA